MDAKSAERIEPGDLELRDVGHVAAVTRAPNGRPPATEET